MLPYVGIPTFARATHHPLDGDWHADAAILGIPFDIALGFRPGARFGPRAIREASLRYAVPPAGLYDWRSGIVRLAGVVLADLGDVDLPSLEPQLAHERITAAARIVRRRARLPLFLGGDHSVTYPLLRAYDDVPGLHVVQLDAHLDFTDVRDATRWSNSSPFRRAVEALPDLRGITTIGLRGLRTDPEAVQEARMRGHALVHADDIPPDDDALAAILPQGSPVYLSIDLDVLDPSVLPGTSSPEVDGLLYRDVMRLVQVVAEQNDIVGVDIVELCPPADPGGGSALVAARLGVECLATILG
ncbi:MAG: arginase family protein [Gemmatimonadaceae bacterium]|nr:arginase family protein [Gemmatimonadaceae bacterium]